MADQFTRWLQHEFNQQGADLKVTGENDVATQQAIREFQEAVGVPVTGTATPETMAAYRKAKSFVAPAKPYLGAGQRAQGSAIPRPPVEDHFTAPSGPPPAPPEDMSGPGGSPVLPAQPPAMPSPQEDAAYWSGDISQPPPWSGAGQRPPDPRTGNSPLAAGLAAYQPPDDPTIPPTAMVGAQNTAPAGLPPPPSQNAAPGPPGALAGLSPGDFAARFSQNEPLPDPNSMVGPPWDHNYASVGDMAGSYTERLKRLLMGDAPQPAGAQAGGIPAQIPDSVKRQLIQQLMQR